MKKKILVPTTDTDRIYDVRAKLYCNIDPNSRIEALKTIVDLIPDNVDSEAFYFLCYEIECMHEEMVAAKYPNLPQYCNAEVW